MQLNFQSFYLGKSGLIHLIKLSLNSPHFLFIALSLTLVYSVLFFIVNLESNLVLLFKNQNWRWQYYFVQTDTMEYMYENEHKTKRHYSVITERRHSVTFQSPFSRSNARYISVTIQSLFSVRIKYALLKECDMVENLYLYVLSYTWYVSISDFSF